MENTEINLKLKPLETISPEDLFYLIDKNREHLRATLNWVDFTKTEDDSRKFIDDFTKKQQDGTGFLFAIWYQEVFVGVIDMHDINLGHKKGFIGYWIDKDYQGKGIITEACKLLIKYGFEVLNLNRLEIDCFSDNPKSAAVAMRLGFKKEGILRQSNWLYDSYKDMEVWSLLKSDISY